MSEKDTLDTKDAVLSKIMQLSFAALEANLYLDGHPADKEALLYFRKTSDELCRLYDAYEEEYGPLTACGDGYYDGWQWVKQPFPWEMED